MRQKCLIFSTLLCRIFDFFYVFAFWECIEVFWKCLAGTHPTFSLVPLPLANQNLALVGMRAENVSFFSALFWCFGFLVRFPILGIYEGILGVLARRSPNFHARAFGARELESTFGRDVRQKSVLVSALFCCVLVFTYVMPFRKRIFVSRYVWRYRTRMCLNFLARAFGARRPQLAFGRGARRKWTVF